MLNLKKLRIEYQNYYSNIEMVIKMNLWTRILLMSVLKDNIKYLPPFYNFILTFLAYDMQEIADYYKIGMANTKYDWVKDASIIHYAGLKPWEYFDFCGGYLVSLLFGIGV